MRSATLVLAGGGLLLAVALLADAVVAGAGVAVGLWLATLLGVCLVVGGAAWLVVVTDPRRPGGPSDREAGVDVVRWAWANRAVGRRAVGGWLVLTATHLEHRPHRLELLLREDGTRAVALRDLTAVDVAPRGGWGNLFSGGLRRRLRVTTRDARREVFVVTPVEAWRSALAARLER